MSRPMPERIDEWRGVTGLVAARVLADDNEQGTDHGYKTGDVFAVAGVATLTRSTDSPSEPHFYNNIPALVVVGQGSDTVTIDASAIPLDVFAELTGQIYDETTGSLIECERELRYFALGYETESVAGEKIYVWRYKGSFAVPDQTNSTKNNGTDANGQQLTYTGIATTHVFTKTGKSEKSLVVNTSLDKADVSAFFDTVTTHDNLVAINTYTLSITQGANTTVTVIRGSSVLADGAGLNSGDVLTVYVTGGSMTINGVAAASGDTVTVSANVTIVSAA